MSLTLLFLSIFIALLGTLFYIMTKKKDVSQESSTPAFKDRDKIDCSVIPIIDPRFYTIEHPSQLGSDLLLS
jgi:hypothetical protein